MFDDNKRKALEELVKDWSAEDLATARNQLTKWFYQKARPSKETSDAAKEVLRKHVIAAMMNGKSAEQIDKDLFVRVLQIEEEVRDLCVPVRLFLDDDVLEKYMWDAEYSFPEYTGDTRYEVCFDSICIEDAELVEAIRDIDYTFVTNCNETEFVS